MTDAPDVPVVHIEGNSREQVAYKLLYSIAKAEDKRVEANASGPRNIDRKWLLDTYAECLMTVRDPDGRLRGTHITHEEALEQLK